MSVSNRLVDLISGVLVLEWDWVNCVPLQGLVEVIWFAKQVRMVRDVILGPNLFNKL
jgi:hypothetical protein